MLLQEIKVEYKPILADRKSVAQIDSEVIVYKLEVWRIGPLRRVLNQTIPRLNPLKSFVRHSKPMAYWEIKPVTLQSSLWHSAF
jgi:hypothetical protein